MQLLILDQEAIYFTIIALTQPSMSLIIGAITIFNYPLEMIVLFNKHDVVHCADTLSLSHAVIAGDNRAVGPSARN